ncbi:MAG TPA: DUF4910 domain-containing protein [Candidatus Limnocylindria bacterium]|nr:DUF4910 domain-containing protein [Candidatus Limnocylindria bacterium]
MFQGVLERVRREASGPRALETVRALARFHRVQASPGYDQAADWMADQLEALGLGVEVEKVPGDGRTRSLGYLMPEGWECTHAIATFVDGDTRQRVCDYGAEKLSLILRSAPARGRYPIVVVDDGTEDANYAGVDVKGAVVLTGGVVQRVHQLAVVERGAAGLLYDGRRLLPPVRDRFDDPDALTYTSFWWNGEEPRAWGFVLSPRAGERVRERLRSGARPELDVEIESRAFTTDVPLLSTRIPGQAPGEVLILAHLCHPQPSANDNASGAAAVLECARVLAALRSRGELELGPSLRFLWVPELTGTYAWLAHDAARARGLLAAVNLDMVGQDQERCGSTLLVEHPPWFSASFGEELLVRVRERAVDWVRSYSGPGHYSRTRMAEVPYSGGSDHVVFTDPALGVPCPMLIQWPDRYYHTSHDTPDKTDPASLELAVRCAATYAAFVASAARPERHWLLDAVGRGARQRLLRAADAERAPWQLERERRRGLAGLGSLARLGVDAERVAAARRELEAFVQREGLQAGPGARPGSGSSARPARLVAAPLHDQRHLLPGFDRSDKETRERWHRLDAQAADAAVLASVAWYACDGRRTLGEIAEIAWLETGQEAPDFLATFFAATAKLGLSTWSEDDEAAAFDPDARDTAAR